MYELAKMIDLIINTLFILLGIYGIIRLILNMKEYREEQLEKREYQYERMLLVTEKQIEFNRILDKVGIHTDYEKEVLKYTITSIYLERRKAVEKRLSYKQLFNSNYDKKSIDFIKEYYKILKPKYQHTFDYDFFNHINEFGFSILNERGQPITEFYLGL